MSKRIFTVALAIWLLSIVIGTQSINVTSANFMEPPPPAGTYGTIYIRTNGAIEPSTAPTSRNDDVYTFTGNTVNFGLEVQRGNVLVDGAGYVLQRISLYAPGTGIFLNSCSNVTISNFIIRDFVKGIYIDKSSNSNIIGNVLRGVQSNNQVRWDNQVDIVLSGASSNVISSNTITTNGNGIVISDQSTNNIVSDNNITKIGTTGYGISISCGSNTLRNNKMYSNGGNCFGVDCEKATSLSDYNNDIDASNTVDGDSICYWVKQHDQAVPYGTGYVALISCNNIKVENLNLANNKQGVLLVSTTNSEITENRIANNTIGIAIYDSRDNTFSRNTITSNSYGIMAYSSGNKFKENHLNSNGFDANFESEFITEFDYSNTVDGTPICYWINQQGKTVPTNVGYVVLIKCSNIIVQNLNVTARKQGILLISTTNSVISRNLVTNNDVGITLKDASNGNVISGNQITNNRQADINLTQSHHNSILGNKIGWDTGKGLLLNRSTWNFFKNNYVANCSIGLCFAEASNNTIVSNRIENIRGDAIQMGDSGNNNITDNHIMSINGWCINCFSLIGIGNNIILRNNLFNGEHALMSAHKEYPWHSLAPANTWSDGEKGNYWNDYTSRYPAAMEKAGTGTGDIPYCLNAANIDHHPLTAPVEIPNLAEAGAMEIVPSPSTELIITSEPTELPVAIAPTNTPVNNPTNAASNTLTNMPTNTTEYAAASSIPTSELQAGFRNATVLQEYLYVAIAATAIAVTLITGFRVRKRFRERHSLNIAGEKG